ncbi:sprouty-related, EVH1 domain-containing protein 2-like isoform X2 [Lineus longissimus]|uniref:sprouty-related, EVH1 domain-containing protein 2-like isoform X2 n=1 Tax=Lineus longissimus TaxID=88925 RepID=UPI00315DCFBE
MNAGNGNNERRHEKCLHHCLGAISAERPIQRPVPRQLKSDDCLVQVRAQVMTRDDELVGWVPMGGGGWSAVGLMKRLVGSGEDIKPEYVIQGERVSDKSVVLNCRLKKDLQYTQATPTFHHWRTQDKKFGLTFQKNSDARAFDNGVKRALEDLLEGTGSPESTQIELGDDDVFVTLDLPLGGRKDSSSQSASTTSTTTSSPTQQSPAQEPFISSHHHANHQHLHMIKYVEKKPSKASPSSDKSQSSKSLSSDTNTSKEDVWVKHEKQPSIQSKSDKSGGGSDPDTTIEIKDCHKGDSKGYYVQFARNTNNDYSYPQLDSVRPSQRKDSLSSLKKIGTEISLQPPLPGKKKSKKGQYGRGKDYLLSQKRSRCVYCSKMFVHEDNCKGSCEDAPDRVHDCIEQVSCICCATSMLYHCMSDAEGDYGHPCVCDTSDDSNCKKWTALTVLSFFVPCLWCYLPLTACHRCGVSCGCCGGRHKSPVHT